MANFTQIDQNDNKIIESIPADGIRFKDLIEKTGFNPSTLRYRVYDLVVAGILKVDRRMDRNRICLTVYHAENAGIVNQSVAGN